MDIPIANLIALHIRWDQHRNLAVSFIHRHFVDQPITHYRGLDVLYKYLLNIATLERYY